MRINITSDQDIISARTETRSALQALEFPNTIITFVVTSVSELSRNIIRYAIHGNLEVNQLKDTTKVGVEIIASDNGPGIENLEAALQDGYSTSNSLGLGLPGVRRIMDEFSVESTPHTGTRVRVVKWHHGH